MFIVQVLHEIEQKAELILDERGVCFHLVFSLDYPLACLTDYTHVI
jgi:hypothetical protein